MLSRVNHLQDSGNGDTTRFWHGTCVAEAWRPIMEPIDDEEARLRSVALQNAQSTLLARQRAEEELVNTRQALEKRTKELASSTAILRATLGSATDGILVTDSAGCVTHLNEEFVSMWRVPPEIVETRDHRRFLETTCQQLIDHDSFHARINEIYATAPA